MVDVAKLNANTVAMFKHAAQKSQNNYFSKKTFNNAILNNKKYNYDDNCISNTKNTSNLYKVNNRNVKINAGNIYNNIQNMLLNEPINYADNVKHDIKHNFIGTIDTTNSIEKLHKNSVNSSSIPTINDIFLSKNVNLPNNKMQISDVISSKFSDAINNIKTSESSINNTSMSEDINSLELVTNIHNLELQIKQFNAVTNKIVEVLKSILYNTNI